MRTKKNTEMHPNEKILHNFYNAFKNKDYKSMQNCYADDAVFKDEIFQNLSADQVKMMWEMLLKTGKNLSIEFKNISADDKHGKAQWKATYNYGKTNKKIINTIRSKFIFENNKIINHTDKFKFHCWACQAFGLKGLLTGWMPSFKREIRANALKSLAIYTLRNRKN